MRIALALFLGLSLVGPATAQRRALVRLENDRVQVAEFKLKPGETAAVDGRYPAVTVYMAGSSLEFKPDGGHATTLAVKRGDTIFSPVGAGAIRNAGPGDLQFERISLLGPASTETWGAAGLAPNYKVLIENPYVRVYDIRIPAGGTEPQHTHKARVVVCLSGARLKHLLPDGTEEPSTLETGEIAWRPGATHIGQNLGNTNLWVIAVEPK